MACILAHLFNSVSRQCWEVWASHFPFLHSLKELVPPSEACLYGHINWSLAQAHSVGFSQSFPPKRGGKARPQTGFQFTVQKRSVSGSVLGTSGAPLLKWPHLESGNEAHPHGTKPILFLCHRKGLCIVIYLDDISVLVCSKQAG